MPAPEDLFEAWEISPAVNRVANDYPGLLEPVRGAGAAGSRPMRNAPADPAARPPKRARKPKKDERQSSLF